MSKEKTDLQVFQEWVQELKELVFGKSKQETERAKGYTKGHTQEWLDSVDKPKRARTKKGTYRADDPNTKDFNEAYVGGKAPKKRKKNAKK